MTKNVDVFKLANELEITFVPETRKEIEELVNSLNGTTVSANQLIQELVAPMIGIVENKNREFTITLIQRVVDELAASSKDD